MKKTYENPVQALGAGASRPPPSVFIVISYVAHIIFTLCSYVWQPAYYVRISLRIKFILFSYFDYFQEACSVRGRAPCNCKRRDLYEIARAHLKGLVGNLMD